MQAPNANCIFVNCFDCHWKQYNSNLARGIQIDVTTMKTVWMGSKLQVYVQIDWPLFVICSMIRWVSPLLSSSLSWTTSSHVTNTCLSEKPRANIRATTLLKFRRSHFKFAQISTSFPPSRLTSFWDQYYKKHFVLTSVTTLGYFLKDLLTNFLSKEIPKFGLFCKM